MGMFQNFPWTNFHDLNLDWILEEVKKLKEAGGYSPENPPPYPVTSVNGKTGAVVLFNEQEGVYVRFPDSENDQWNIYRLVDGVPAGIQFSATLPAKRMQGSNRFAIYDEGNPPPYPVTSVNGKTGAVVLFSDHDGAYIQFPDSNLSQWNVYRIIDEQTNGIQFHKNGAAVRMQGNNRYQIYDQGNPPPYPVTSVNGQTGAAETPFTDHTDDVLEFVAGAVGASWGLKRTINTDTTDEAEVEFTLQVNDSTGAPEAYIASGETVKKLLTEDDIPSSSGVVSVNGLTGVVTLNGANLPATPDTQQTVAQAIAAEAQARAEADTSQKNNIAKIRADVIADGAGAHNAIYRGKYLGSSVTAEQWEAIRSGTFAGLFIGDYWTINGVNWRIAAFDYWVNANSLSTHHVVIVPDTNLVSSPLNSTHTTAGAYYNSDFRTGNNSNTGRATAIAAVNATFGSGNILTYKDYLHSAVVDGHPSGQEWADCTVELMNEEMVYGGHIFAPIGPGTSVYSNYTTSKSQLPLFQHDHSRISNRDTWWLRSVVSDTHFAVVVNDGSAANLGAGNSRGVRPAFGIC